MNFKLTEEQMKEVIELYGGSITTILFIEESINNLNIIDDEEDYLEIVTSVVAQHQTVQQQISQAKNKSDRLRAYMSLDEIIEQEMERKYGEQDHKQYQLRKIYPKE